MAIIDDENPQKAVHFWNEARFLNGRRFRQQWRKKSEAHLLHVNQVIFKKTGPGFPWLARNAQQEYMVHDFGFRTDALPMEKWTVCILLFFEISTTFQR